MNKKILIPVIVGVLLVAVALSLVFIIGKPDQSTTSSNTPSIPYDPSLNDITGVTFDASTVTYNGESHSITVAGTIPSGVTVNYTNNIGTNAGTYNATALLSGEGYNSLLLNATLTIEKANMTGITLTDVTVEYDALPHSINVVGNVPSDAVVTYKYNSNVADSVTDGGTYTVEATLTSSNYNTLTLTATLIIKTTEKQLYSAVYNGKVYFQNPLDGDALYAYDNTSGLVKINRDNAKYLTSTSSALYYQSSGLLSSSIRSYNGTGASTLLSSGGEYLVCDGNYLYFAVNNLIDLNDMNGIYKYDLSSSNDPERIYEGKASYLTLNGSTLYFAAGASSGQLMKISTSGTAASLVNASFTDEVSDIILHNGYLYFNRKSLTNCYLMRYQLSTNQAVQMTIDAGKNLTVIGSYLYYINTDILTGAIFGDGIYKVALNAESSVLPGTKVLDSQVSSLSSVNGILYYYKLSNKHFYSFDESNTTENDLMQGFVPTSTETPIGEVMFAEYKGEIFYIDPMDNGAIYKYNPQTGAKYKVISASCSTFYFNGDTLYYSTYILTNYALWKIDLNSSAPAVKINTGRCANLIFDGNTIYYIKIGATKSTLRKMNADGTDDTELLDTKLCMYSLGKVAGKLYVCTDPVVGYKKIMSYDIATGHTTDIGNGERLICVDTNVFYYNQKDKTLVKYDTLTNTGTNLVASCEITSMAYYNGDIYYADAKTGATGLYKVGANGGEKVLICSGSVCGVSAVSNGVWFMKLDLSYVAGYPLITGNDGKLYFYNGSTVTSK